MLGHHLNNVMLNFDENWIKHTSPVSLYSSTYEVVAPLAQNNGWNTGRWDDLNEVRDYSRLSPMAATSCPQVL